MLGNMKLREGSKYFTVLSVVQFTLRQELMTRLHVQSVVIKMAG